MQFGLIKVKLFNVQTLQVVKMAKMDCLKSDKVQKIHLNSKKKVVIA